MHVEKKLKLEGVSPIEFFGPNNLNFNYIKSFFPLLNLNHRGSYISVSGDNELVAVFEQKIDLINRYLKINGSLNENIIENLIQENGSKMLEIEANQNIILHGVAGSKIKARTLNQKNLVKELTEKDLVFAVGPAGTGKTYTAVAMAVKALKNKEVKRIVLTRPAVEAGENLGFLPGDLKEKLDPYLMPLYDALREMIPAEKLNEMLENGIIEIAPLAFMRGRTLDKAFVILDEAQNATIMQIKMFLTRMGLTAKFAITGDMSQIDLPSRQKSGLKTAIELLSNIDGIGIVKMTKSDVIRHKIVRAIVDCFDQYDEKMKLKSNE